MDFFKVHELEKNMIEETPSKNLSRGASFHDTREEIFRIRIGDM